MKIPKNIANNKYFLIRYYLFSHLFVLTFLFGLASVNGWHELFISDPTTALMLVLLMLGIGFGGILPIMVLLAVEIPSLVYLGKFALPSFGEGLLLVVLAMLVGVYSASFMHHASHGHFRYRLLNRAIGELCALHQLIGFWGWKIPHIAHHLNADVEGKDPHAPAGMGFLEYSKKIKSDVLHSLKRAYCDTFPNDNAELYWKCSFALIWTNRIVRVIFWYALLGVENFILFFVISYLVQLTFYVHFNWVTHEKSESGGNLIRDLDGRLYYRIINKMMWGMFYHGAHHEFPSLMDPRNASARYSD